MKLTKLIFATFFLFYLGCPAVFACKYNVRDVGFVDLETRPYGFFCYINDSTEKHVTDDFKEVANAELPQTNIKAQTINVDLTPEHPVMQYLKPGTKNFPVFIFISPERKTLKIEPIETGKDFKESMQKIFNKIVHSPARKEITEKTIDAFGVVLIVEGPDAEENKKALISAQAAIKTITIQMNSLPKAIAKPPVMLKISLQQHKQENILLWSMGIDADNITQPHAVVLYGRGRRMGFLLSGKDLTEEMLLKFFYVIGADCECGLDRSWMQGNMMPARWSRGQLETLSRQLGFDTEHPMVKTEISRIIRKGNWSNRKDFDLNKLEGFNLGYQEFRIELDSPEPASKVNSDIVSNGRPGQIPLNSETQQQPPVEQLKEVDSPKRASAESSPVSGVDEDEFRLFNPLYMIGIAGIIILAVSAYLFISTSWKK